MFVSPLGLYNFEVPDVCVTVFLTEVQTAGGVDHAASALGLSVQSSISVNLYVAIFPSSAKKIGHKF